MLYNNDNEYTNVYYKIMCKCLINCLIISLAQKVDSPILIIYCVSIEILLQYRATNQQTKRNRITIVIITTRTFHRQTATRTFPEKTQFNRFVFVYFLLLFT